MFRRFPIKGVGKTLVNAFGLFSFLLGSIAIFAISISLIGGVLFSTKPLIERQKGKKGGGRDGNNGVF